MTGVRIVHSPNIGKQFPSATSGDSLSILAGHGEAPSEGPHHSNANNHDSDDRRRAYQ